MKKEKVVKKEFKIEEHLFPLENQLVVETVFKKAEDMGGIVLSTDDKELKKEMFHVVKAVGKGVEDIKVGALVLLRPGIYVPEANLLGVEYVFINKYDILSIISEELRQAQKEYLNVKRKTDTIIKLDNEIITSV